MGFNTTHNSIDRQIRKLTNPEVQQHVLYALHSSGNRNPGSGEEGQGGVSCFNMNQRVLVICSPFFYAAARLCCMRHDNQSCCISHSLIFYMAKIKRYPCWQTNECNHKYQMRMRSRRHKWR